MGSFWDDTERGISAWAPAIEVFEKNGELHVKADLPEGYYRCERQYGSFYRVIPLPEGAITENAKANFKDGVLEVTIPAPPKESRKGRRIQIEEKR